MTIAHWFQIAGPASAEELKEALLEAHTHFAALQASVISYHIYDYI